MAGEKVLLVEGSDDEHVLKHICGNWEIGPLDEIRPAGSWQALLEEIPVQAKRLIGTDDVMGVVVDADFNLASRWDAVCRKFRDVGYLDVPSLPNQGGTIFYPPVDVYLPKAGVWIMPNNQLPGILEDFLLLLVPSCDQQLAHAKSCVESINEPSFSDKDKSKALIHTWLAWQADPGKPYGTAITAQFLDPTMPSAKVLADWLQRLFR